jgi:Histone deacetylase domain
MDQLAMQINSAMIFSNLINSAQPCVCLCSVLYFLAPPHLYQGAVKCCEVLSLIRSALVAAGMGWCPFDDIMLAIRNVRRGSQGAIKHVMLIDLDAHQGNGVERDKLLLKDDDLYILDAYNCGIFPGDKGDLTRALHCTVHCMGNQYLSAVLVKCQYPGPVLCARLSRGSTLRSEAVPQVELRLYFSMQSDTEQRQYCC